MNKLFCISKTTVQINRTDQCLHRIRHHRIAPPSAGRILAFSKQQKSTQIDLLCAECKRRLADQTRTCLCHIALRHLRKRAEQEITRYHFQHRVA